MERSAAGSPTSTGRTAASISMPGSPRVPVAFTFGWHRKTVSPSSWWRTLARSFPRVEASFGDDAVIRFGLDLRRAIGFAQQQASATAASGFPCLQSDRGIRAGRCHCLAPSVAFAPTRCPVHAQAPRGLYRLWGAGDGIALCSLTCGAASATTNHHSHNLACQHSPRAEPVDRARRRRHTIGSGQAAQGWDLCFAPWPARRRASPFNGRHAPNAELRGSRY